MMIVCPAFAASRCRPAGSRRPTTQKLVVFAEDAHEARHLLGAMDESSIDVRSNRAAKPLSHAILVDTPDTDSTGMNSAKR